MFEKLSGLKPNSVTWVTMDAASMPPTLIRGATDAVPFFVVHEARIRKIAKQQNVDLRLLTAWADLGLDLSSTSLVAREDTIAKDPEGLKAFLRATLKGANYAFRDKHFEEGVGYVVKHHPEVDPEGAVGAAQVAARFVYAEEVTSGKMALGQFEPARIEKTRDTYTQYLELKRKVPLEEIYTNDLLPEKK
jgi:NitT/TauT family transport system substrate-binding protein